jgi:hypothetical protein
MFLHASAAQIDGLLSDADEDGKFIYISFNIKSNKHA